MLKKYWHGLAGLAGLAGCNQTPPVHCNYNTARAPRRFEQTIGGVQRGLLIPNETFRRSELRGFGRPPNPSCAKLAQSVRAEKKHRDPNPKRTKTRLNLSCGSSNPRSTPPIVCSNPSRAPRGARALLLYQYNVWFRTGRHAATVWCVILIFILVDCIYILQH